jgi:hypothetical protein
LLGLTALACLLSAAPAHADPTGILRVVFTYEGLAPAVSISVNLISPDRVRQARTDKSGRVEFAALPFQIYELEALSGSFEDVSLPGIQIMSSEPMILNVPLKIWYPLQESERLCPPPLAIDEVSGQYQQAVYEERTDKVNLTGKISINIRNPEGKGTTITLVKPEDLEIGLSQAISDANGVYEFKDLEPGKYGLIVSLGGVSEKSHNFHFWVTRENLTRLGNIVFGMSQWQDICGGGVMISLPARIPYSNPPIDLDVSLPLPLPSRSKSTASK